MMWLAALAGFLVGTAVVLVTVAGCERLRGLRLRPRRTERDRIEAIARLYRDRAIRAQSR